MVTRQAARVPRLWPGADVVCLGSGPSLTRDDVDYCRGRAHVIAVNDTFRLAPFADALMASDAAWWKVHAGAPGFAGLKFCLEASAARYGVTVLEDTGDKGLELEPTGLKSGRNSGAAAVNLAVHFGAARILLLGYDMHARDEAHSHFFGAHKRPLRGASPYELFRELFRTMAPALVAAGVEVLNCSVETALTVFRRVPLREALP